MLPSKRGGILTTVQWIAGGAAVAQTEVEVAVRAEGDLTTIVVAVGLGQREDDLAAFCVHNCRVIRAHAVVGQHGTANVIAVVHEEAAVAGEVRMKGQPQQPAFGKLSQRVPTDVGGHIEKGLRLQHVINEHLDQPGLLQQEKAATAVAGVSEVDRAVQPCGQRVQTIACGSGRDDRW